MSSPSFTNASNFASDIKTSVDTRIGVFNASLELASVNANSLRGPRFPLTLSYRPYSTLDFGLGIGWSLSWTTYRHDEQRLTTSTGEDLIVDAEITDGDIPFYQSKRSGVSLQRMGDQAFRVWHDDGQVEILTGASNAFPHKVPTAWFTPDGLKLKLEWQHSSSGSEYWFSSAEDEEGSAVASVEYDGDSSATLKIWPNGRSERIFQLEFDQRKLISISSGDMQWDLGYDEDSPAFPPLLNSVSHPNGLRDTVDYQKEGHKYPQVTGAPEGYVPYVVRFERDPGSSQPSIVQEYTYTDTNYLGYESGLSAFSQATDNLYNCPDEQYVYGSTVTMLHGSSPTTTKRVYNKYHLLTTEKTQTGDVTTTTTHAYESLVVGAAFDEQPNNFQCPTGVRVEYSNGTTSRSEAESMEWNSDSHLVRHVKKDGVTLEWDYYPPTGDGENCPPDPGGRMSRIKNYTVTPRESASPSPTRKVHYTYGRLAAGGANDDHSRPVSYAVVLVKQDEYADERLIKRTTTTYVETVDSPDHGRVRTCTETLFDGATEYPTTVHFSYSRSADKTLLIIQQTGTAFDGKSKRTSQSLDVQTGLLASSVDEVGVVSSQSYDALGRVLERVAGVGTKFERRWQNQYHWEVDPEDATRNREVHIEIGPYGDSARHVFDGFGRQLTWAAQTGDVWRILSQSDYDDMGRVVLTKKWDYIPGDNGAPFITRETAYSYDDWGNPCKAVANDGYSYEISKDPVALVVTRGRGQGAGHSRYEFDPKTFLNNAISRVGLDKTVISTRYSTYDGEGRLVQATDETGNVVSYTYDDFNRMLTQTLPDQTVVVRTYAGHSADANVTSIKVGQTLVGTQAFDGLSRVKEIVVGGRKKTLAYRAASDQPQLETAADGRRLQYSYIPELGNSVSKCEELGGTFTRSYKYFEPCGNLQWAQAESEVASPKTSYEYDEKGRLTDETVSYPDEALAYSSTFTYSDHGRTLKFSDVGDVERQFEYDAFGRAKSCRDADMSAEAHYDSFGRLAGWDVATGKRSCSTTLEHDDFDRETRRETTYVDSGMRLVVEQEWYANDQMSVRSTYLNGGLLRKEEYTYDKRNRLSVYLCSGSQPPRDAYGKAVQEQHFEYDALSNITTLRTVFEGGENTATYGFENTADPCQLTTVTHSHADYPSFARLTYDKNGRMTIDEAGRLLSYDALGRLASVEKAGCKTSYAYDSMDVLRTKTNAAGDRSRLFYRDGVLISTIKGAREQGHTRFLRLAGEAVAQYRSAADAQLFAIDDKASVLATEGANSTAQQAYTPYGHQTVDGEWNSDIGFNGQLLDDDLGGYQLGNGYRVYSPTLMRFTSPDAWSPFGAGGVNAYAYCAGDPINGADPSGHMSGKETWALVGLGLAIFFGILFTVLTFGTAAPVTIALVASAAVFSGLAAGANYVSVHESMDATSYETVSSSGRVETKTNGKEASAKGWGIAALVLGAIATALSLGSIGVGIKQLATSVKTVGWGGSIKTYFSRFSGGNKPEPDWGPSPAASESPRTVSVPKSENVPILTGFRRTSSPTETQEANLNLSAEGSVAGSQRGSVAGSQRGSVAGSERGIEEFPRFRNRMDIPGYLPLMEGVNLPKPKLRPSFSGGLALDAFHRDPGYQGSSVGFSNPIETLI